jgi:hypothetical protein
MRYVQHLKAMCGIVVLLCGFTGAHVHAQEWIVKRLVNDPTVTIGTPSVMANSQGGFMLAYPQGSPGSAAMDYKIYAVHSEDGISWSEPYIIRDVPGENKYCHLAFLSSDLSVIAWHRKRPVGEAFDIWLAREVEGGSYWETEQVTDDPNDDKRVRVGVLSDDSVVLVFPRHMPAGQQGNKDIALARFDGSDWQIEMLSDNDKGDHRPVLAIDGQDNLHTAYAGYVGEGKGDPVLSDWHLFYTTNLSGEWIERIDLTEVCNLPNKADSSDIAIDLSGNVHIVTAAGDSANGGDREVYHITNESGIWTSEKISNHTEPCESIEIAIGADGSIHAVYQVGRIFSQTGNVPTRIWYAKRPAKGAWNSPIMIDDPWNDSATPDIAINASGNVVVAYKTKIGGAYQLVTATLETTSVSEWGLYE